MNKENNLFPALLFSVILLAGCGLVMVVMNFVLVRMPQLEVVLSLSFSVSAVVACVYFMVKEI